MLAPVLDLQSRISNPPSAPGRTPSFVIALDAPLPTDTPLVRIPLAITGQWVRGPAAHGAGRGANEFSISLQDLEEIVRNFHQRLNGEINVDYDHASEMPEVAAGGPIPSAGRIVRLDPPEQLRGSAFGIRDSGHEPRTPKSESRFILYGWYEPTPRARQLIKNREYRYISPALDWAARSKRTGEPQGATLTSVALTNRPFLEELPQIRLSDLAPALPAGSTPAPVAALGDRRPANSEFRVSSFEFPASNSGGPMKQVTLSVADGKIKIVHEDLHDEYFAEPQDLKTCLGELGLLSEVAPGSSPAPAGAEGLAPLPGAGASSPPPAARSESFLPARQEISVAQASQLLCEADARGKFIPAAEFFRAQVERELEDAVKAGKVLPRQRDAWRKIALSDFPTFRHLITEQKTQVPLRPMGLAGAAPEDVQAQVKFLAEQRMRERHVSFGQALSEIGREQPELVHQYRRAVSS